ncbi:hypothetical protein GCM10011487_28370 [Steroidobacter agaridevorans]|uniref:Type 4 fimbrial biogenesis protein PilX N-terminal domain-containing protein n=1 Tax=Steroidobacter agaridevorans TaxID=2695856 RepID=A0A829YC41_9GAMM|nr:PilX N-terminal domain-containing pilus assembly protein [Steroidobacter agaridevorans]GFE80837.1 hypothetical protein GCM10011487_28370 [Steroidobacter agaridevorans]GFE87938.1 hypothetical protein GCM10011488_28920 [Steroidobacter agaridevorans]
MPRICFRPRTSHRQAGAALVVALLLLVVLTLLAISGVNSSTLNLVMAGNTQLAQNAFQAAETGIEYSVALNEFNPDPGLDPETQKDDARGFEAISKGQLCGMPQPALPGSSLDSYSTFHFQIDSTGKSKRQANSVNIQAIAIIAPADASVAPAPDLGAEVVCPPPAGGGANNKFE